MLWNYNYWDLCRCYSPTLRDYLFNRLVTFSFFHLILSFQTLNHEEILYKNSLMSCPLYFHNMCLPHGKPYLIKLNFIFDSSFLCCAWLCCYGPTSGTTHLMDLVNFSLFILSYLIVSDFELWEDSLWELTYLMTFTFSQTRVCLMANLIPLNLTLFLIVHFHAVHGYVATHMHITHVMLLFH